MSVMWSRPSTPPRSMKAPKSVMFFTMPLRTWPTSSSFIRTSRLVLRSASSSTRRDTTMLRRRLLSLMILNSKLWPSSSSMLGTRRSAIWLPGRNASTPMRSTTTPPLIFFTSVPLTASSRSWASRIRSHTRMKSAFFFERTTAPSWSSRCSRKTSISSPSFRLRGSLNSSIGTAPSDLNPTSRMTAVSVTRSTFDLTISPSSMFERVPSYSSVIFAISSGEYSSWRSARTRRGEWRLGVAGPFALGAGGCWGATRHPRYPVGCGVWGRHPGPPSPGRGGSPPGSRVPPPAAPPPPAVPQRRVALLHVHPVPHLGDRRDLRHPARHPLGANRLLHVHAGDLGPKHVAHEHQSHWQLFGERDDPLGGPGGTAPRSLLPVAIEGRERNGPVQRSRIEVRPAEPARHRRGRRGLSRRRRAVDRDDPQSHVTRFTFPATVRESFRVSRILRRSAKNRG